MAYLRYGARVGSKDEAGDVDGKAVGELDLEVGGKATAGVGLDQGAIGQAASADLVHGREGFGVDAG